MPSNSRNSRRYLRPIAALVALFLPVTAATAANWLHVSIYSAGEEPKRYFFVLHNSCHKPSNWRGEGEGCTAWLISQRNANLIAHDPLGNRDIKANTRFYIIPVCAGRIFWKNNIPGKATSDLREIKLICNR
jgi:hypothetical protein